MPTDFQVRTVLAMRVLSSLTLNKIPSVWHKLFNADLVDNLDIIYPIVVSEPIGKETVERSGFYEVKDCLFKTTNEAV